jgi:nitroreductase
MEKSANAEHPIHELIAKRWSPCGFTDRPVSRDDLLSLFEAARCAASSYNEQPWHYLITTKDQPESFGRMLTCLVEPNRDWAQHAPVLVLTVAGLNFTRNGKPNTAAWHDIGSASATLSLEATARGLSVHQMIGILPDKALEIYEIPEGFQAVTALAIGYAADPETLESPFQQRDTAVRQRKGLSEFVFGDRWGTPAEIIP